MVCFVAWQMQIQIVVGLEERLRANSDNTGTRWAFCSNYPRWEYG